MIAIDSDVLAVHHIFVNDARFPENLRLTIGPRTTKT